MSVGFGFSVGDFIAGLKLVGVVIDALQETSEATSSNRELLNELLSLENALRRVKRVELDDSQNADRIALQQAAAQCQRTIDDFWAKAKKDQPHLKDGGTGSRVKDGWVKLKWTVCKKKDVERFKADLHAHTGSIEVLLLTVQMNATALQARKQEDRHLSLAGHIQQLSCQWMAKLSKISDGVTSGIQQGKTILEISHKILRTNLQVFAMVYDIQKLMTHLPAQIDRQQPIFMIDAFGRESPFHLEFVRSASALRAVLRSNLEAVDAQPEKIDRGEFVIQESGSGRDIDLTKPWETCFLPGQRVAMSMVFKSPVVATTCPACMAECPGSYENEVLW